MKAPLLDILTRIRRKTSELGAIFLLLNPVLFHSQFSNENSAHSYRR